MQEYSSLPRKPHFTSHENKSFLTNFFQIQVTEKSSIHQYSFECQPQVPQDSTNLLSKIIHNIYPLLKNKIGLFSVRGNSLYGTKDLLFMEEISSFSHEEKQTKYIVAIKKRKSILLREMMFSSKEYQRAVAYQIMNISTKQKLKKMNMIQLSKGRFYNKEQILDNDFRNGFCVSKGYKFSVCSLTSGIYIQIDIFSRLIRQRNLLEEMNMMKTMDGIQTQLEGATVIAKYGTYRTYQIISVDFKMSPLSKFLPYNEPEPITYREFYRKAYDKQIQDTKQPLIMSVNRVDKHVKKDGKVEKSPNYIYLVPQLLSLVGLSEQHRKDSGLMRDIIVRTQFSAENRLREIETISEKLNNYEGLYKVGNQKRMNGYVLDQPKIQLNRMIEAKNGEIKIKGQLVKEPAKFSNWYLVYTDRYDEDAEDLEKVIFDASRTFGIKFSEPVRFNMGKTIDPSEYKEEINLEIKQRKAIPEVIMFLVGNSHKENFYREMKSFCTLQLKIPSQFITIQKYAGQKKKHGGLMSLASNLILQMNIKVGKILWEVPIRNPELMKKKIMCGSIAISKFNKENYLGFIGTINNQLTKIYNETKIKKTIAEFDQDLLVQIFVNWLKTYFQYNNKSFLPDIIIFYREGISRYELSGTADMEIKALKQMVEVAKVKAKNPNFNPEIFYYTVIKNSNSRYYENASVQQKFGPQYINPCSGSVILEEMASEKEKSFHITPHQVNVMTTSNPSQYILCYHEPKRSSEDALVDFTFEQCFNYYNWKGAIKFPSTLQNANKLSKQASKSLSEEISLDNKVNQTYHFL